MGWIKFILLHFKRTLLGIGRVDFLCGFILYGLSAFKYYKPKVDIDMDLMALQIPLMAFGTIFVFRFIFIAPYLLWKEEREKYKNALIKPDALRIGFYSKKISFLYDDLIENWSKNGVESIPTLVWFHTPHRSHEAYYDLREVSNFLLLNSDVRDMIVKFLNYFYIEQIDPVQKSKRLKTKIKTRKEIDKKLNEIKNLAEKLSKDLNHVAKPKEDE